MGGVPRCSTRVGGYPPFYISTYLWAFGLQESCSKSMWSGRYPTIFLFKFDVFLHFSQEHLALVLRFWDIMFVGRDLLFLLPSQDVIVGPNYKRSIHSRNVYRFSVERCIPVWNTAGLSKISFLASRRRIRGIPAPGVNFRHAVAVS